MEQWIIGAKIDFLPYINPHHLLSSFFPIETPSPIEITKISPATYVAAMDHWNIGAKLAYPPYNAPYLHLATTDEMLADMHCTIS